MPFHLSLSLRFGWLFSQGQSVRTCPTAVWAFSYIMVLFLDSALQFKTPFCAICFCVSVVGFNSVTSWLSVFHTPKDHTVTYNPVLKLVSFPVSRTTRHDYDKRGCALDFIGNTCSAYPEVCIFFCNSTTKAVRGVTSKSLETQAGLSCTRTIGQRCGRILCTGVFPVGLSAQAVQASAVLPGASRR